MAQIQLWLHLQPNHPELSLSPTAGHPSAVQAPLAVGLFLHRQGTEPLIFYSWKEKRERRGSGIVVSRGDIAVSLLSGYIKKYFCWNACLKVKGIPSDSWTRYRTIGLYPGRGVGNKNSRHIYVENKSCQRMEIGWFCLGGWPHEGGGSTNLKCIDS